MRRKRIAIMVNADPYEELRRLTKELGWRDNWLGLEIDKMVEGALNVATQAKIDAMKDAPEPEEVRVARYEEIMRKSVARKK